ncbi:MAG: DUF4263 domain-containing protein [Verrucomicrobia bacterium]|jgi:hypothetical protein|nr:DUF4263 domain-containing protein [Verrucomicrobiota bacterium]MBT7067197.1 DUF4263 domain-containing protein [Verrucomicrobiota bacterium]
MTLERTYVISRGPAPPSANDYSDYANSQWQSLLNKSPAESEVQAFLEHNPAYLPGAWTPGTKSGHYPLHCAVIAQPLLPGLRSKRPDFMWIAMHSLEWYPTLIEIEAPSKRLFTRSGTPRADFTQARNQLAEWRTWFADPSNVQVFTESYGIPYAIRSARQMRLHMVLVYGRRDEFDNDPRLAKQRASLMTGADEELMSYDRLAVDRELGNAITVRADGNGRYKTVAVPPLFHLGPNLAERLLSIDDLDAALRETPLMSEERRAFLLSRLPYWRSWAQGGARGIVNTGDWE